MSRKPGNSVFSHPGLCVCMCVCLSVCYHSHVRTDKHADLNFGMKVKWKDIYVQFIGQGHRSKVKVTRSKNVHKNASLTFEGLVYGHIKETEEYHW